MQSLHSIGLRGRTGSCFRRRKKKNVSSYEKERRKPSYLTIGRKKDLVCLSFLEKGGRDKPRRKKNRPFEKLRAKDGGTANQEKGKGEGRV